MAASGIRVFIAGDIYVERALVRRFLEDDGYEVVGEGRSREDLVTAIRRAEPDAIVVDDELLTAGPGGGTMGLLRRGAPDAKIIVFTSGPAAGSIVGADGYLEKGVALSALTTLLSRLFTGDSLALEARARAADAAGGYDVATAGGEIVSPNGKRAPRPRTARPTAPSAMSRLAALSSGAILIVWGLVAMIASGGGPAEVAPADTTDQTGGGTVIEAATTLDGAYAVLDRMMDAIETGNYVLASVEAQELMEARERALADGFALSGLDAEITARLATVVGGLPIHVNETLAGILGTLYPSFEDEPTPGGGSDILLGPTIATPTVTTPTTGGTGGTATGGGGGGGGGGDGGGGGGVVTIILGPGDGRAWGQSHTPPNGGWGGPPPWANGKALGHAQANGKANGKANGQANGKALGHLK